MVTKKVLKRFPRMNAAYRAFRESRHLQRRPVSTSKGFLFSGDPQMQSGEFEPHETELISGLLNEADVFINVGANVGYYCCIALQKERHVVAFEPVPSNLALLLRNLEVNGWENAAEVFPIALGETAGIIKIFGKGTGASLIPGWAGQTASEAMRVPISTLDLTLTNRFDGRRCLVVVDIEGAELGMLRGASRLLSNNPRPIWMVEITVGEHQPEGVHVNPNLYATFELFHKAGYQATTVSENPRTVGLDEVAEIARTGVDTLSAHNFLFRYSTES